LQLLVGADQTVLELRVSTTSVAGRGAWLCGVRGEKTECADDGKVREDSLRVLASCVVIAKQKKAFARGFRRDVPLKVVEGFLARFG
jgi:predicted RNA-binding protein YlxR (DUF448 family)